MRPTRVMAGGMILATAALTAACQVTLVDTEQQTGGTGGRTVSDTGGRHSGNAAGAGVAGTEGSAGSQTAPTGGSPAEGVAGAETAGTAGVAGAGTAGATAGGAPESNGGAGGAAGEPSRGGAGGASTESTVEDASTVGVGVTADLFCSNGTFSVTIQPRDGQGNLVSVDASDLSCNAALGSSELACTVDSAHCVEGSDGSGSETVVLVILDDSHSMVTNDPEELRGEACQSFVNQLGDDDVVAITDFGNRGSDGATALRTLQAPTADKDLARAACLGIAAGPAGTPIYGSVVDAVEVFYPAAQEDYGADVNFSVLMVSDGEPDSDTASRTSALEAAQGVGIPIYTVGLGPAAEGGEDTDPDAVSVLQELSLETGGAYASSVDAAGLEALFEQVGTVVREGSCAVSAHVDGESFTIGEQLSGVLVFTKGKAETAFGFTIPTSELDDSRCSE